MTWRQLGISQSENGDHLDYESEIDLKKPINAIFLTKLEGENQGDTEELCESNNWVKSLQVK